MKKNNSLIDIVSIFAPLVPGGWGVAILNAIKYTKSISDKLFYSKYLRWWSAIEEYKIEIDEFIKKVQEKEDWKKVGKDFLLIIDSFSCFDKSYYYGKLWVAWLKEEVDTNEFMEMVDILQNVFIVDLQIVLKPNKEGSKFGISNLGFKNILERLYKCNFLIRKSIPFTDSLMVEMETKMNFATTPNYPKEIVDTLNKSQEYKVSNISLKLLNILSNY